MEILITTIRGNVIILEVEISDNISSVKRKIQAGGATPLDDLLLIFTGEMMRDHLTLADYGVYEGCSIFVLIRWVDYNYEI